MPQTYCTVGLFEPSRSSTHRQLCYLIRWRSFYGRRSKIIALSGEPKPWRASNTHSMQLHLGGIIMCRLTGAPQGLG